MPDDKPVWPEYWNKEDLDSVKASISTKNWNAQYMQDPTFRRGCNYKKGMVAKL